MWLLGCTFIIGTTIIKEKSAMSISTSSNKKMATLLWDVIDSGFPFWCPYHDLLVLGAWEGSLTPYLSSFIG